MHKRIPFVIGIILVFLSIWLLITPISYLRLLINQLDALGYDLQLRTYALGKHIKPTSPVAIIDIDNKSLKAEGHWPWPRSKLAQLVYDLKKQGAVVIAFDIFFAEKQDNIAETVLNKLSKTHLANASLISELKNSEPLFDDDILFAKSLSDNQTILPISFLPNEFTQNTLKPPLLILKDAEKDQLAIPRAAGFISNIPILQQAAKGNGFINIIPDNDGIIRRAPLLMSYRGGIYPALSLQAVLLFLNENIKLITPLYDNTMRLEGIQFGETTISTDAKGQVLIPFIGPSYTFPYYSATDVLHGKLPKDALLGKILFVGTSATGIGDLKATAIQNPFPGVEIQATLANGLLQNNFSYQPEWTIGANIFITAILGFIAAFLFPYLGPRILSLIVIFVPLGLLFLNNYLWQKTGLVLSFLVPIILILLIAIFNIIYGYLFETRRRETLKKIFGQYVPEKHIDEMLQGSGDFGLHGDNREMSVLFADIRNFTSISESVSATELVDLLNTFFTPMTEIIFKYHGTIDKYVGDLIMAFWSAPLKDKNHARHAIQSGLSMIAKLKDLQPILAERNWPEIKIGIGINSGMMVVGDMGSRFRRNYTVIGDAVNLASRIEDLTKLYGVDMIVTETSADHQNKFIFRKLDRVRVKGKKVSVTIYEVACETSELTEKLKEELELYHKGLDYYFAQKWDEAEAIMLQLSEQDPEKKLYRLYLDRIQKFKEHPLPPDWDGTFILATK